MVLQLAVLRPLCCSTDLAGADSTPQAASSSSSSSIRVEGGAGYHLKIMVPTPAPFTRYPPCAKHGQIREVVVVVLRRVEITLIDQPLSCGTASLSESPELF